MQLHSQKDKILKVSSCRRQQEDGLELNADINPKLVKMRTNYGKSVWNDE